jgi:hypothetical protein
MLGAIYERLKDDLRLNPKPQPVGNNGVPIVASRECIGGGKLKESAALVIYNAYARTAEHLIPDHWLRK